MGGIAYALGSALTGAAEGLHDQAVQDNENQRQSQLLAATQARETALEQLRASNAKSQAGYQATLDDSKDADQQARRFSYATAENTQKQTFDQQNIKLKGAIDVSNDKQVAALKQQYDLTDIQVKATADLQNQLALAGQTADHWGVTTDGRMVAFNKKGDVLKYSANPSSFIPSGQSQTETGDGFGGDSIAGERATRGGGKGSPQANPSAPAAPPTGGGSVLSQLAKMPPPPDGAVGRTMTGPNGIQARWNGKMWVLIGETVPRG